MVPRRDRLADQRLGDPPAAFCGVVGFKPTHGLIPRSGALLLSRTLDHVGVFARTVEDAALLAETLAGFDEEDPDTRPLARPPFAAVAASEPPLPPRFAFVRSPVWDQAEPATHRGLRRAGRRAGRAACPRSSSARASSAPSSCIASSWKSRWRTTSIATTSRAATQLSPVLRAADRARPRPIPAVDYMRALAGMRAAQRSARRRVRRVRRDPHAGRAGRRRRAASTARATRCSAPSGPISARRRSRCRCCTSENGLPIGVQLVGRRGNDARLLRTAHWLVKALARGKRSRRDDAPARNRAAGATKRSGT